MIITVLIVTPVTNASQIFSKFTTFSLEQTALTVEPPTTRAMVGENFTIQIDVINVDDLHVFDFKLQYDTSVLDFLEIQVIWQSEYDVNDTAGIIWVSAWNLEGLTGDATLTTIKFNATTVGTSLLHLYDTKLYDFDLTPISHITVDGTAMVLNILDIHVATDKQSYYLEENITIKANLTTNGFTIQDGLIALEVDHPYGGPILFRTLSMTTPSINSTTQIVDFYPCDQTGNPRTQFSLQTFAYFNITVKNFGNEPQPITVTLTVYDSNSFVVDHSISQGTIIPNGLHMWIPSIPIPPEASLGTAKAYANLYTNWPKYNGTPYHPEVSTSFEIYNTLFSSTQSNSNSATTQLQQTTSTQQATYNSSFFLFHYEPIGIYTAYVCSNYYEAQVNSQVTFMVLLQGDIDGSGKVDYIDLFLFGIAWMTEIGDPNYNPDADFNSDGIINVLDLFILAKNWMKGI